MSTFPGKTARDRLVELLNARPCCVAGGDVEALADSILTQHVREYVTVMAYAISRGWETGITAPPLDEAPAVGPGGRLASKGGASGA